MDPAAAFSRPSERANPNPIKWDVYRTFYEDGQDIPLRYGQHDYGSTDGFGTRHIEDGHPEQVAAAGWDDVVSDTARTLHNGTCRAETTDKQRCTYTGDDIYFPGTMVVVHTQDDSRPPDGRPLGVITAYHVDGP